VVGEGACLRGGTTITEDTTLHEVKKHTTVLPNSTGTPIPATNYSLETWRTGGEISDAWTAVANTFGEECMKYSGRWRCKSSPRWSPEEAPIHSPLTIGANMRDNTRFTELSRFLKQTDFFGWKSAFLEL